MGLQDINRRVTALLLCQVIGVSLFNLDIEVERNSTTAIWLCTTDIILSECHVAWMDFGRDREVTVVEVYDDIVGSVLKDYGNEVTVFRYSGRGLAYGDCGVEVRVTGYVNWMVGCRVKGDGVGWKYAWSEYTRTDIPRLKGGLTVEPHTAVVLPGKDVAAVCHAEVSVDSCLIGPAEMKYGYVTGDVITSERRHTYEGRGLSEGDCGIRIRDAGEEDNGPMRCQVKSAFSEENEWKNFAIVVADAPVSVTLETMTSDGRIMATCTVVGGRPSASIAWHLDDDLLRRDDLTDQLPGRHWVWPWMSGSIVQHLPWRPILPGDHGSKISCIVTHPVLGRPVLLQDNIVFSDPPEFRTFNETIIIKDLFSTSTTESGTSLTTESSPQPTTESSPQPTTESSTPPTTESSPPPTTESSTPPTTESSTPPTTESSTPPTTESSTTSITTTTTTTSTTTEGPHTDCCCYVKRCHTLFRNGILKRTCANTYTCQKIRICCPQL